ncbi:hypothetical protein C8R46DRAFT_339384 [Mycena filopes]|nr:hypothetical protein C8R46DRAFT_339384 [Mycena filopes]
MEMCAEGIASLTGMALWISELLHIRGGKDRSQADVPTPMRSVGLSLAIKAGSSHLHLHSPHLVEYSLSAPHDPHDFLSLTTFYASTTRFNMMTYIPLAVMAGLPLLSSVAAVPMLAVPNADVNAAATVTVTVTIAPICTPLSGVVNSAVNIGSGAASAVASATAAVATIVDGTVSTTNGLVTDLSRDANKVGTSLNTSATGGVALTAAALSAIIAQLNAAVAIFVTDLNKTTTAAGTLTQAQIDAINAILKQLNDLILALPPITSITIKNILRLILYPALARLANSNYGFAAAITLSATIAAM